MYVLSKWRWKGNNRVKLAYRAWSKRRKRGKVKKKEERRKTITRKGKKKEQKNEKKEEKQKRKAIVFASSLFLLYFVFSLFDWILLEKTKREEKERKNKVRKKKKGERKFIFRTFSFLSLQVISKRQNERKARKFDPKLSRSTKGSTCLIYDPSLEYMLILCNSPAKNYIRKWFPIVSF